jgi:hypothetical protein
VAILFELYWNDKYQVAVGVARQMLHEQHAIVAGKAYGRSYWLARMATAVRH